MALVIIGVDLLQHLMESSLPTVSLVPGQKFLSNHAMEDHISVTQMQPLKIKS